MRSWRAARYTPTTPRRCPSPGVKAPRPGHSGAVLLHCFSCQAGAADITAALGLRLSDLFDNPAPPTAQHKPLTQRRRAHPSTPPGPLPPRITVTPEPAQHQWRRVRVHTYTTAAGWPVQQVIRQECSCGGRTHKRFQQRYRHGRRWVYHKPQGFTPGLYRGRRHPSRRQSRNVGLDHRRRQRRRHPHQLGPAGHHQRPRGGELPRSAAGAVHRPARRHRRRPRPGRLPARHDPLSAPAQHRRPGRSS